MSQSTTLEIVNSPSQDLAKTNCVFASPGDAARISSYIQIGDFVFTVRGDASVAEGSLGLNSAQRKLIRVSTGDRVSYTPFDVAQAGPPVAVIHAKIEYFTSKKNVRRDEKEFDAKELIGHVTRRFGGQVLTVHQTILFEYIGSNYMLTVNDILAATTDAEKMSMHRGVLLPETEIVFETVPGSGIKVTGQKAMTSQIFKQKEFNFEALGIGGLDSQFEKIFRRAFASRIFPPDMLDRLGIHHVKGVLLHGPPGTGKTLIARQIGKMLNGKEPKIVNGPEILSKYVGASEENVRKLFEEAEQEYREMGDASELHVIIFDEIDAICKQRGSVQSGTGVHDTVVNQLLTKIDGVDALNNILLIGMTNRRDMLDDALLRPGRLEVQVEIGLPDDSGRLQILQIHTAKMSKNSFLADDVDLFELATRTKNFSGAELEGLVKSAASFALNRQIDVNNLNKTIDEDNIKVCMQDFITAMEEVIPAFGATVDVLNSYRLHGMVDYGPRYQQIVSSCKTLVRQVENSENNPLVTALLEGPPGSGKTALASTIALESEFPLVKMVSAESMVGMSEAAKCHAISKIFDDAYKSPLSFVILDEIERLLEYVPIGPRFSNAVLQTILVLLKKPPPEGRRLFVIGTTSAGLVMEDMDVTSTFNVQIHVPQLTRSEMKAVLLHQRAFSQAHVDTAVQEVPDGTSIKRLLLLLDLARQGLPAEQMEIPISNWTSVIQELL
ncbi:hypothetical protein M9434_004190 [Picochlorum sp. BPE23]|nr:hypothetical protein M9434_004190 [Picochlorum sp. BPE23]